eukprot:TRINITY_DN994_c1_g3_i1.p1 TRINITY_DN994_c1_g3~~TRINITY_DN994_c1_g3_i1.p1  ORF type:complete len:238 (-),score=120.16 TRINITY_DN994_c1_g3_i1:200-862(-)
MNFAAANAQLVESLIASRYIQSIEVREAFLRVLRSNYVTNPNLQAFVDSPQSIGYGVTISAPHMHAYCLEALKNHIIGPNRKILDVGSGSGFLTACFGVMTGSTSKVFGIETIKELVDWSNSNLSKDQPQLLEQNIIKIAGGDGWAGLESEAPFDAIHVGAAAATIPQALINQLKSGGRLIIPVGAQTEDQYLLQIDKNQDGSIEQKRLLGVRYVPLVKK